MPSQSNWLSSTQSPRPAQPTPQAQTPNQPDLRTAIKQHLTSKSIPPSPSWLTHLLSILNTSQPLPALKASALYRTQHTDLKTVLAVSSSNILPANIHDASIALRTLSTAIVVQVLAVEDIGRSRWSQVEAIESFERGETTKGREVIRAVPGEEGLQDPEEGGRGPHKLLLEDGKGTRVWAFEMSEVQGVGLSMGIGAKMVLKGGTEVARAVVMLEGSKCQVLGGKVDEWNKAWKEGGKGYLKKGIEDAKESAEG